MYLFIYDATVSTFWQYFIFVKENEDCAWSHLTWLHMVSEPSGDSYKDSLAQIDLFTRNGQAL